jgi:hypothetical protein
VRFHTSFILNSQTGASSAFPTINFDVLEQHGGVQGDFTSQRGEEAFSPARLPITSRKEQIGMLCSINGTPETKIRFQEFLCAVL